MIKNYSVQLDIEKDISNKSFEVRSSDVNSIEVMIKLTDNYEPINLVGLKVRLATKKIGGKEVVMKDCEVVDGLSGVARCWLNNNSYIVPGKYEAEALLYRGSTQIATTSKFKYESKRGIKSEADEQAESLLLPIDQKLAEVESMIADFVANGSGIDAEARDGIESINTEMETKATRTEVTTGLASKVDTTVFTTEVGKKASKEYVDGELAKKVNADEYATAVNRKADKTYVDTELAKKVSATTLTGQLSSKADKAEVDTKLSAKADKATVDTALAGKANKEYVDTELGKKVSSTTLTAAVSVKADKSYVDDELSNKASVTEVQSGLDTKADKTTVNTELNKKADKVTVEGQFTSKADKSYVDAELAKKANFTATDNAIRSKADKTYVDTELAKKVSVASFNEGIGDKADEAYVNQELAKKANSVDVASELSAKANKSFVDAELLKKADKATTETAIAKKAEQTFVVSELLKKADAATVSAEIANKADKVYTDNELAKKVNATSFNTAVNTKADKAYVDTELAKKAVNAEVNTKLNLKADKASVDAELVKKADKTAVDSAVGSKAEKSYVDNELAKKANTAAVNTEIAKKADKVYVDTEIGKKADTIAVNSALATKANVTEVNKKADQTVVESMVTPKADKTYVDTKITEVSNKLLALASNELFSRLSIVNGKLYIDGQPIVVPTNPTNPTEPEVPVIIPPVTVTGYGLVGKWFDETINNEVVKSTHYPGSAIKGTFSGTTKITGNFVYIGRGWTEAPIIAVRVNGGAWTRKVLSNTVELVTGLEPSQSYEVEIVFDGWNQGEHLWNTQRKFTFKSFTLDQGGLISYTDARKNVLFVGDSITAGTMTVSNSQGAAGSSAVSTYARMLADSMGVDIYPSAFPGTKVLDSFTRTNVHQVSNNITVPNYNIHTIFVMMGTNDYQQPSADFITNYQLLINSLRSKYPTQRIYIMGLVERTVGIRRNTELAQIAAKNARVTHIDTSSLISSISMSDGLHPNETGSRQIHDFVYPKLVADDWANGGGKGNGEAPVDPTQPVDPTNPEPTVPAGNLWTAAGNPAYFTPLGPNYPAQLALPGYYAINNFTLKFEAKSASGNSTIKLYTNNRQDFDPTPVVLTTEWREYTFSFDVTYSDDGNLLLITRGNNDLHTDIEIKNIKFYKTSTPPAPEENGGGTDPTTINIWTEAGKSADYNPLPHTAVGFPWADARAGKSYELVFTAFSPTGQSVEYYTDFRGDLSRSVELTTTPTEYKHVWNCTYNQGLENNNFFLKAATSPSDVVITGISLHEYKI